MKRVLLVPFGEISKESIEYLKSEDIIVAEVIDPGSCVMFDDIDGEYDEEG
jgi:hypothetical protein